MNLESLCLGCMRDKGNNEICPHCGWSDKNLAAPTLDLPPRSILNGHYIVGKVLGSGGFGVTYLAWDINLDTKVSNKRIFP
jgi:hypothetical protein